MSTVDEIVTVARELSVPQFLRLRRKLDRLEGKIWEAEQVRVTAVLKRAKITDRQIDRMVMRRRREGRP